MAREVLQQSRVAFGGNGADGARHAISLHHGKEAKSNDRRLRDAAGFVVAVLGIQQFIEVGNVLRELSAETAHEPVAKLRELPQDKRRPVLDDTVGLRNRDKDDRAFPHGLYSGFASLIRLASYSGSFGP